MCLITPDKKLYIAEKKITVYKTLKNDLTPYFMGGEPYVLGKLNETTLENSTNPSFLGGLDIDWFKKNLKEFDFLGSYDALSSSKILKIGQGFHVYNNLKTVKKSLEDSDFKDQIIVKCTIPKGAKYHTSPFGLMVSNKLIVNRVIEY